MKSILTKINFGINKTQLAMVGIKIENWDKSYIELS